MTCSQSASSSSSSSSSSLPFQALLHAYLRLPATVLPAQTHVKGFNSLTFRDKVQGGKEGTEDRDKVPVDGPGGEMDRVYLKTPDVLNVGYQGQRGGMRVSKKGLSDAVVSPPASPALFLLTRSPFARSYGIQVHRKPRQSPTWNKAVTSATFVSNRVKWATSSSWDEARNGSVRLRSSLRIDSLGDRVDLAAGSCERVVASASASASDGDKGEIQGGRR